MIRACASWMLQLIRILIIELLRQVQKRSFNNNVVSEIQLQQQFTVIVDYKIKLAYQTSIANKASAIACNNNQKRQELLADRIRVINRRALRWTEDPWEISLKEYNQTVICWVTTPIRIQFKTSKVWNKEFKILLVKQYMDLLIHSLQ